MLQHASAFDPPQAYSSAGVLESSIPQFFRERALSLLLSSTLSGADDGCAWLILASAAVGGGNLSDALEHLAHAHQLDMTEACALSNRSIVLHLKGDHVEAFKAVKEAITLRCDSIMCIFMVFERGAQVVPLFLILFLSHPCAAAPPSLSFTTTSAFCFAT